VAVGQRCGTGTCAGFAPQVVIASSNHGGTWTRAAVPSGFEFAYQGTSCVSAMRCLAGGTIRPSSSKPTAGFATTSNLGHTWTMSPIKGLGTLITTTCANAFFCYSVGYANPKASQVAFGQIAATRNGGSTWTVHAFPATGNVNGITCVTPSTCTAFATSTDGGNSVLLHTTDAGAAWSSRVVPGGLGVLRWLTCPAASLCVATSNRAITNQKSIDVTHNGGATWTSRSIGTMNVLYAASCASTTTCEFVGQTKGNDPLTATTVDRGATWPLRPLTAFGRGRLWAISCAARNHCVAVGQWWTHAPSDGGPLLLSD